ncbi:hypothetical protein [Azospirillum doebereinerae]
MTLILPGDVLASYTTKPGEDFLLSGSNRASPAVAMFADGRILVVSESLPPGQISYSGNSLALNETKPLDVVGKIYAADGTLLVPEFVINTTTADSQLDASVAILSDGGFVVTWTDLSASGGDVSGSAIRGQVFAADGSRSGGEFLVNTGTTGNQHQSSVGGLADGGFAVTWTDDTNLNSSVDYDYSGLAVRGQIFAAGGSRSGDEFQVSDAKTGITPKLTVLANGDFVVTWINVSVRGQIFKADGSRSGDEFVINTDGWNYNPTVTALTNGGFVVTWDNATTLTYVNSSRGQAFLADGSKNGQTFVIDGTQPALYALPNGRFIAAASRQGAGLGAVVGQVYTSFGGRVGAEFLVNTTQGSVSGIDVAARSDGTYVVAWVNNLISGSASGLDAVLELRGRILSGLEAPFNPSAYAALNPDLFAGFGTDATALARHYMSNGQSEARAATGFDADAYAALNPDLFAGFGTDAKALIGHYISNGRAEGRAATGFDADAYAALNPDLFAGFGTDTKALIGHYISNGRAEGRAATGFDADAYAALNPDLFAGFGTNAKALIGHYISNGRAEGRAATGFDADAYAVLNPDLLAAFGTNATALITHYANNGRSEGRDAGFGSIPLAASAATLPLYQTKAPLSGGAEAAGSLTWLDKPEGRLAAGA